MIEKLRMCFMNGDQAGLAVGPPGKISGEVYL
jgi:hypothetical protein